MQDDVCSEEASDTAMQSIGFHRARVGVAVLSVAKRSVSAPVHKARLQRFHGLKRFSKESRGGTSDEAIGDMRANRGGQRDECGP